MTSEVINKIAHGFSILDPLKITVLGDYVLAQADDSSNLAAGVVVDVPDVDNFEVAYGGTFDVGVHGLALNESYYLDPDVLGGAVLAPPTSSSFIQTLYYATDTTTVVLQVGNPSQFYMPFGGQEGQIVHKLSNAIQDTEWASIDKVSSFKPLAEQVARLEEVVAYKYSFVRSFVIRMPAITSSSSYKFKTGIPSNNKAKVGLNISIGTKADPDVQVLGYNLFSNYLEIIVFNYGLTASVAGAYSFLLEARYYE